MPDNSSIQSLELNPRGFHIEFDSSSNVVNYKLTYEPLSFFFPTSQSFMGVLNNSLDKHNLGIGCTIFPMQNFSESQIIGLTAFVNATSRESIEVFEFLDLKIFCSKKLYNKKTLPFLTIEVYSFYVQWNDLLLEFYVNRFPEDFIKETPELNKIFSKKGIPQIDFNKILNFFEINGMKLIFSFDDHDNLINVSETKGVHTKQESKEELKTRFLIGVQNILENYIQIEPSSFSEQNSDKEFQELNMNSITKILNEDSDDQQIYRLKKELFDYPSVTAPPFEKELANHLKTYYIHEHNIVVRYREDLITSAPYENSFLETFYFDEAGNVTGYSVPKFSIMAKDTANATKKIKLKSSNIHFLFAKKYSIDFSAIKYAEMTDEDIKALTYFFNSLYKPTEVVTTSIENLTIYTSNQLINEHALGFYPKVTNIIFIRQGDWIYKFRISGENSLDIKQFLNLIEVNGIGLDFKYESNKLVKIEKKAATQTNLNQD